MRVVVPCVNSADFLATTLPAWRALLPAALFTVVTSPDDEPTWRTAATVPEVRVHATQCWQADGAIFNKGRALDEGFGFGTPREPEKDEVCVTLDADVYPFGRFPREHRIKSETLYGCPRYYCPDADTLRRHIAGETTREQLPLIFQRLRGHNHPLVRPATKDETTHHARAAIGFFQVFRWRPGVFYGDSRTAGGCDIWFRQHFKRRQPISKLYVLHLGELSRRNWRGRVVAPWEGL